MAKTKFEAALSLEKECEVLEGLSKMGSAGNPSNGFETFSNIDSRWNSSKPSVFYHCQSLQSNITINARHLIGAGIMFLFTDWKPNVSFAYFCVFCEITVVWVGWSGVQSKQKILRVKGFDWISRLRVGQRQALVCLDVCLDGAKCFPDWQQLTSGHTWHALIAKMNSSGKTNSMLEDRSWFTLVPPMRAGEGLKNKYPLSCQRAKKTKTVWMGWYANIFAHGNGDGHQML